MHPSGEIISAYLDGELTPAEALSTSRHLRVCASCTEAVTWLAALDRGLAEAPALSCETARPLVSARIDGELDAATAAVADVHLASCVACQGATSAWTGLDEALAALPLEAPSAAVDAALERFRHEPVPSGRRPRFGLPSPIWPARALAAVAVAIAVLLGIPQQAAPQLARPGPQDAIVASVQQSVLDSRTGTLYVLRTTPPSVAALDAATLVPRMVISVGGTPTALALNEVTDQVLVLDAQAKTVTAIDSRSNSVVSATTVSIPGTPTSIQVDNAGKVVVASIIVDGGTGPSATLAPQSAAPQTGAVSVLDPTTKTVQTVSQVDVAPRQVVIEPSGKRALLVSSGGTTIVDAATYKPLDRAPGGIAAAFSGLSGEFAILTVKDGAAFVDLSGHGGVTLTGSPRAITALPNGGYAVLTESGGAGRVTTLAADGTIGSTLPAPAGRDITFDPLSGTLAIIGPAGVSNVPLALAAVPSALPSPLAVAPSTPPLAASPQPSAPPTASASPAASSSPTLSPEPSASVAPAAIDRPDVDPSLVPTGARLLTGTTYLYSSSRLKRWATVAGDGTRMWSVDASNVLTSLHTDTG
ncbi:MAG: zf-HC2 domain-containing protein, partial [Chloroflexota bacterium]|nr:zf-HC2 domain-containing protein [Chloroflexota bacterium]